MNCLFHSRATADDHGEQKNRPAGSRVSRRTMLGGMLGLAGAGGVTTLAKTGATAEENDGSDELPDYPFEGKHQQGVITPPQKELIICGLDVLVEKREELKELLQTITERARVLTTGGPAAPDGIAYPATDSGELGEDVPVDGLTITLGAGATLFDDRFGLKAKKPKHLNTMKAFADDSLDPAQCHGDLVLQICAHNRDTAMHALRDILRHTRGGMAVRWRQSGYQNPPRPSGTQRNHLGFKDGIVNPTPEQHNELVWAGGDEPKWAAGGSYMAVRLIVMLTEFWDRISIAEQEQIFGRERFSGGPLSGGDEWEEPDYLDDPTGDVIPVDAHIRLANPRTEETANQLMLRRAYNYDNGVLDNGTLDVGLVFVCFQQDLQRQFITVQRRLEGEPLADYIRPYGGGYFYVFPGVSGREDFLGKGLFFPPYVGKSK